MRMELNASHGARCGLKRVHGFKESWKVFPWSITTMPLETPGQHFAVLQIVLLFLEAILILCRMAVGWTAAWVCWPVLRCCEGFLRIFKADLLSRFAWSIGQMRKVHDSAVVFSDLRRSQVRTPSQSTAFGQT